MSAKKSWDVQRKSSTQATARVVQSVRVPAPISKEKKEPLKARRKKQRKAFRLFLFVFCALVICTLLYLLWRPALRISAVSVMGPSEQEIAALSLRVLEGSYLYVVPKNSIFFYPEKRLREEIVVTFPEVVAVSMSRSSFTSVAITAVPRMSAFVWCAPILPVTDDSDLFSCYDVDAQGLIFKENFDQNTATSTLHIFAGLEGDSLRIEGSPVGMRVAHAEVVPPALLFVKTMKQLGIPVESVTLRGDEADLRVGSTRITYVLGKEAEAAQLAVSVLPQLNLTDGSVEYLDLRFVTKAYIKKSEVAK